MGSAVRSALIRLCEFLLTALLVSFFTFSAFAIIPGDTARVMLGPEASEEQVEALREELGLNAPLAERYIDWLKNAFRGDFGNSLSFGNPVGELIASRLPVTLGMSLIALIFVIAVSFPMAAVCSRNPGSIKDKSLSTAGHILFAIPPFALSMILIWMMRNNRQRFAWMPAIPLIFYSFVVSSYILNAQIGFRISWNIAYCFAAMFAVVVLAAVIRRGSHYSIIGSENR